MRDDPMDPSTPPNVSRAKRTASLRSDTSLMTEAYDRDYGQRWRLALAMTLVYGAR